MDAAVLFDFGGTLDADGITWKERFFRLCLDEGVTIARERFDPVFYAADDALVGGIPRHAVDRGHDRPARHRRRGRDQAR